MFINVPEQQGSTHVSRWYERGTSQYPLAFSWHVQDPSLTRGSDGGQKSTELTCELKRTEAVPRRVQGL